MSPEEATPSPLPQPQKVWVLYCLVGGEVGGEVLIDVYADGHEAIREVLRRGRPWGTRICEVNLTSSRQ